MRNNESNRLICVVDVSATESEDSAMTLRKFIVLYSTEFYTHPVFLKNFQEIQPQQE